MAARKPKIEYYWCGVPGAVKSPDDLRVNWHLVGANGEIMCQSTQGFRDKADARRSVDAVIHALVRDSMGYVYAPHAREVGPGRKPS